MPDRPMPDHQLEAFRRDPRDCSASEVMQLVDEIDRLREENTALAVRWQEQYDRAETAEASVSALTETVRDVATSLAMERRPAQFAALAADTLHTACDHAEGQS